MKKIIALILCALMLCAPLFTAVFAEDDDESEDRLTDTDGELTVNIDDSDGYYSRLKDKNITLNVYNWGQYISDGSDDSIDVNAEFSALTGIRVNYTTFESNEAMYNKLSNGGVNYDIIIPSDYMVGRMAAEGMLEELDYSNIPNYKNVDEKYKNQDFDPDNKYSVPYTWGTVGLIYNSEFITEAPDSWSILWDQAYSGKILMFDNPRDAFAITEYLLGYSINTKDEAELQACADKLGEQKPLVQNYVMDQIYDKMIKGEAYVAPYYAGDYMQMKDENENLEFVFPKEGFNYFIDAMCIPKGAENKEAAEMYINFMCEPEISASNLSYIGYSTPIPAAKEFLDEEIRDSDIVYPTAETLSRSSMFSYLGKETNDKMEELWNVSRTSGSNTVAVVIGIAAVAAAIAAFFIFRAVRNKKRLAAREA